MIYKISGIKFYFPERGDTRPMKNNIGHSKLITTRHFVSATAWHEAQSPVGLKVKNEYFLKVIELINRSIFYVPFSDSKWAHHQYLRQKACVRMTNILKSKKLINDNLIRQVMASKRSPLINVPSDTNLVIAPPPTKNLAIISLSDVNLKILPFSPKDNDISLNILYVLDWPPSLSKYQNGKG